MESIGTTCIQQPDMAEDMSTDWNLGAGPSNVQDERNISTTSFAKLQHLANRLEFLKSDISVRSLRLNDILEAQKYYLQATQAEMWMKDKLSQIYSCEWDHDVFSVEARRKKLFEIHEDTDCFRQRVEALGELSSSLIERNIDNENIYARQVDITDFYDELCQNILETTSIWYKEKDCLKLKSDIKDLTTQLKATSNATNPTDCGRDAQQIEGDLNSIEGRVQSIEEEAKSLFAQFHDSEDIEEEHCTSARLWGEGAYKAFNRNEKLIVAKELQAYFEKAKEFHVWIHEMIALLTSTQLPSDSKACEISLTQITECKSEMYACYQLFDKFESRGLEFVSNGHYFSQDIMAKVSSLRAELRDLLSTWLLIQQIFEQNRDLQLLTDNVVNLETYIHSQRSNLADERRSVQEKYAEEDEHESTSDVYCDILQELAEIAELEKILKRKEKALHGSEKCLEQGKLELKEEKEFKLLKDKIMNIERCLHSERSNLADERRSVQEKGTEEGEFKSTSDIYCDILEELAEITQVEEALERKEEAQHGSEKCLEERKLELKEEKEFKEEIKGAQASIVLPEDHYGKFVRNIRTRMGMRIRGRAKAAVKPEKNRHMPNPKVMGSFPIHMESYLSIKQERERGGTRSSFRSWKGFYAVLTCQYLFLFKDEKNFLKRNMARPAVDIIGSECFVPTDYLKKKHVFRVVLLDQSVLLFEVLNEILLIEWMQKIQFFASVPPEDHSTPKELTERRSLAGKRGDVHGFDLDDGKSSDGSPRATTLLSSPSSYITAVGSAMKKIPDEQHEGMSEILKEDSYFLGGKFSKPPGCYEGTSATVKDETERQRRCGSKIFEKENQEAYI